jgi:hypothetical protein
LCFNLNGHLLCLELPFKMCIWESCSFYHTTGILASTAFGHWPWWEGRNRKETIKFVAFPPSFLSSKLQVSDSLWGSNSNISEPKNAGAGYTQFIIFLVTYLLCDICWTWPYQLNCFLSILSVLRGLLCTLIICLTRVFFRNDWDFLDTGSETITAVYYTSAHPTDISAPLPWKECLTS